LLDRSLIEIGDSASIFLYGIPPRFRHRFFNNGWELQGVH
jgi:hypothetical protein